MPRRRSSSHTSPPAQLPPLEDENLLWEILLRLPPLPSSLPRASVVCKRWLSIVSDPRFIRSFLDNHTKPPLLGFFFTTFQGADFVPTLDPPDRIPGSRFSLPQSLDKQRWGFLSCRHGLCLLLHMSRHEAVVWDPITGHQRMIALSPGQDNIVQHGAVLRAACHGRVHGECSLNPFKVVLLYFNKSETIVSAHVYESESGVWGNIVSVTNPDLIAFTTPSILVGNALCWLALGGRILEFDLQNQRLVVTEIPANHQHTHWSCFGMVRTQEYGPGIIVLTRSIIEVWVRKVDSDGTARLVLHKTVDLQKLLPLGSSMDIARTCCIRGFDEETDIIFLSTDIDAFIVNIELLHVRKISPKQNGTYYPYINFITPVHGYRGTEGNAGS